MNGENVNLQEYLWEKFAGLFTFKGSIYFSFCMHVFPEYMHKIAIYVALVPIKFGKGCHILRVWA